jgi:hypothetical protein
MSIIGTIFGSAAAEPIKAVGNVLDKLFTSDDERLDKKILLQRLAARPLETQAEINKLEAQHRSLFVAGWRPFIGWICGCALGYQYLLRPIVNGFGQSFPTIDASSLHSLVVALLGLGVYRTVEKIRKVSK